MSRGFPSMTALLGLLAVAGYQNRDKIAEMLGGAGQGRPGGGNPGAGAGGGLFGGSGQTGGLGGVLEQLRGSLGGGAGGAGAGGFLNSGIGELIDRFKQNGQGETADSWVRQGPNRPVTPSQLQQAIGPDVLATLEQQTGLSREELLARLSRELPNAIDQYTPDGRMPHAA